MGLNKRFLHHKLLGNCLLHTKIINFKGLITSFIITILLTCQVAQSQNLLVPSDTLNNTRKNIAYYTYGIGAPTSFIGLYHLWYKEGGMSNFKFFNDNKDWLQLDKLGHATSAYHIAECAIKTLRWAGVEEQRAVLHGGLASLIYMTGIEIMDGFADDYGFSWGDQVANTFGASMMVAQELLWQEQKIRLKYSFFPTEYSDYRPELLGDSFISQALKDYNGQTYWLSINLKSNFNMEFMPSWLNLAVGYSGFNMTGGTSNPEPPIASVYIPDHKRTRQYLLSLDIDLTRIETDSDFLKTVFSVFGFLKIPFTALEYNSKHGVIFHPIYL